MHKDNSVTNLSIPIVICKKCIYIYFASLKFMGGDEYALPHFPALEFLYPNPSLLIITGI